MESTSVQEVEFPLDDLRVEQLEPRLEFTSGGCLVILGVCTFCLTPSGDLDFVCDGSDA